MSLIVQHGLFGSTVNTACVDELFSSSSKTVLKQLIYDF